MVCVVVLGTSIVCILYTIYSIYHTSIFEDVYIGFCVKRLGYNLVNIEGFVLEGDIEYSP
jgi:hypothetical protein